MPPSCRRNRPFLSHYHERLSRKSDAVSQASGLRPVAPAGSSGAVDLDEHAVDPASDVERRCTYKFPKPAADAQEAERRHAEAVAAWEAERVRLEGKAGLADAGALCDALFDRLVDAAEALAFSPASTLAGLASKGDAFLALVETDDSADDWQLALGRSLARDVMRIGSRIDA